MESDKNYIFGILKHHTWTPCTQILSLIPFSSQKSSKDSVECVAIYNIRFFTFSSDFLIQLFLTKTMTTKWVVIRTENHCILFEFFLHCRMYNLVLTIFHGSNSIWWPHLHSLTWLNTARRAPQVDPLLRERDVHHLPCGALRVRPAPHGVRLREQARGEPRALQGWVTFRDKLMKSCVWNWWKLSYILGWKLSYILG